MTTAGVLLTGELLWSLLLSIYSVLKSMRPPIRAPSTHVRGSEPSRAVYIATLWLCTGCPTLYTGAQRTPAALRIHVQMQTLPRHAHAMHAVLLSLDVHAVYACTAGGGAQHYGVAVLTPTQRRSVTAHCYAVSIHSTCTSSPCACTPTACIAACCRSSSWCCCLVLVSCGQLHHLLQQQLYSMSPCC